MAVSGEVCSCHHQFVDVACAVKVCRYAAEFGYVGCVSELTVGLFTRGLFRSLQEDHHISCSSRSHGSSFIGSACDGASVGRDDVAVQGTDASLGRDLNRVIGGHRAKVLASDCKESSTVDRACVSADFGRVGTNIQQQRRLDQAEFSVSDSDAEHAAPSTAELAD